MDFIQWIQEFRTPVLDLLFQVVTMFGEQVLLAGLFCVFYWCVDKKLGRYLILTLCISLCVNGLVKDIFEASRPIGEAGIDSIRIDTATGHSFPSGHSQSAATFWWALALWSRRKGAYIGAGALILLVGLSRLYLGLHYPKDVIVGIALGLLIATACWTLARHSQWAALYLVCAVLAVLAFLFGESTDTLRAGALAAGTLLGSVIEARFARFSVRCGLGKKLVRLLLGGGICGAVYIIPKLLLSGGSAPDVVAIGLVSLCAVGLVPCLFAKLRL